MVVPWHDNPACWQDNVSLSAPYMLLCFFNQWIRLDSILFLDGLSKTKHDPDTGR